MFKNQKYEIIPDQVIIHTQPILKIVALLSISIFLATFFFLLVITSKQTGTVEFSILHFLFLTLSLLFVPVYVFGKKRVIIDNKTETIYQQYLFTKKPLIRFAEIGDIQFVSGNPCGYRIYPKTDRFGKGIKITPEVAKAEQLKDFTVSILPVVEKMIGHHLETDTSKEDIPAVSSYIYYKKVKDIYVLKNNQIIWNSFLVVAALILLYTAIFVMHPNAESTEIIEILPCPMLLVGLTFLTRRKYFNTLSKTFHSSYWGFIKKTYSLDNFIRFNIVRKSYNGLYNGTEIRMEFKDESRAKTNETILIDIRKSKQIDIVLKETKSILYICNPNILPDTESIQQK